MRRKLIYVFYLLLSLTMAGCNSDSGEEVISKDPEYPEEPGGTTGDRTVWSFDVKIMLDEMTFKSYNSSVEDINAKLKQRFKEVRELYHGKKEIYFEADIEFVPFFDETCVYNCSSQDILNNAIAYRGKYPYLIVFDGTVGDFTNEWIHADWTGWGREVVCISENNIGKPDANVTYKILSHYKTSRTLAHELGHARGVPDIYAMEIKQNQVNGQFFTPVTCMMNNCWEGDTWSEYSQLLINHNKNLIAGEKGFQPLEKPLYPNSLLLKVVRGGKPLEGAEVKIYREKMYENVVDPIPNRQKTLGAKGEWELSPVTLFNGPNADIAYGVLLVEVTKGDRTEYRFIPVYELQLAYMKGETENYIIEMELKP